MPAIRGLTPRLLLQEDPQRRAWAGIKNDKRDVGVEKLPFPALTVTRSAVDALNASRLVVPPVPGANVVEAMPGKAVGESQKKTELVFAMPSTLADKAKGVLAFGVGAPHAPGAAEAAAIAQPARPSKTKEFVLLRKRISTSKSVPLLSALLQYCGKDETVTCGLLATERETRLGDKPLSFRK